MTVTYLGILLVLLVSCESRPFEKNEGTDDVFEKKNFKSLKKERAETSSNFFRLVGPLLEFPDSDVGTLKRFHFNISLDGFILNEALQSHSSTETPLQDAGTSRRIPIKLPKELPISSGISSDSSEVVQNALIDVSRLKYPEKMKERSSMDDLLGNETFAKTEVQAAATVKKAKPTAESIFSGAGTNEPKNTDGGTSSQLHVPSTISSDDIGYNGAADDAAFRKIEEGGVTGKDEPHEQKETTNTERKQETAESKNNSTMIQYPGISKQMVEVSTVIEVNNSGNHAEDLLLAPRISNATSSPSFESVVNIDHSFAAKHEENPEKIKDRNKAKAAATLPTDKITLMRQNQQTSEGPEKSPVTEEGKESTSFAENNSKEPEATTASPLKSSEVPTVSDKTVSLEEKNLNDASRIAETKELANMSKDATTNLNLRSFAAQETISHVQNEETAEISTDFLESATSMFDREKKQITETADSPVTKSRITIGETGAPTGMPASEISIVGETKNRTVTTVLTSDRSDFISTSNLPTLKTSKGEKKQKTESTGITITEQTTAPEESFTTFENALKGERDESSLDMKAHSTTQNDDEPSSFGAVVSETTETSKDPSKQIAIGKEQSDTTLDERRWTSNSAETRSSKPTSISIVAMATTAEEEIQSRSTVADLTTQSSLEASSVEKRANMSEEEMSTERTASSPTEEEEKEDEESLSEDNEYVIYDDWIDEVSEEKDENKRNEHKGNTEVEAVTTDHSTVSGSEIMNEIP